MAYLRQAVRTLSNPGLASGQRQKWPTVGWKSRLLHLLPTATTAGSCRADKRGLSAVHQPELLTQLTMLICCSVARAGHSPLQP